MTAICFPTNKLCRQGMLSLYPLGTDIEKASAGGSKMGAFILCSCYIDYLAGFRYGKAGTGKEYKKFIEIYLRDYDPDTIYTDMRCGVVHNYTEGGSYVFVHSLPNFHFYKPGGVGKTTLKLGKLHG